jgi:hypothetical protein
MREAIIAALDANLQREKRGMPRTSATTSDLESVLRVVTGEVGEQRTLLDHAFRTLGETPHAILETVANQATFFVRTAPHNQLPALQLSEWILEAINGSIQPSVEHLRTVGKLAVERLRQIASEMGRSDAPSQDDFEAILRNMPRFEMATLPKPFEARSWKIWGKKILHSRIKASLRASIGSHFENELHLYGMALSQWSDQIVRKLELLVNSYADAYRMQIQRVRATPDSVVDRRQLETDLELLQNWRPANKGALTDTHA